jgi:hypothetical protein
MVYRPLPAISNSLYSAVQTRDGQLLVDYMTHCGLYLIASRTMLDIEPGIDDAHRHE